MHTPWLPIIQDFNAIILCPNRREPCTIILGQSAAHVGASVRSNIVLSQGGNSVSRAIHMVGYDKATASPLICQKRISGFMP